MNKKKLLALLMALVMTLTLVPVTALAEGNVAVVEGGAEHATLQEAIAAATNGDTIKLLADIVLDDTVVIDNGKSVTLDLNSHSVSSTTNGMLFLIDQAKLALTGTGTIDSSNAPGYGQTGGKYYTIQVKGAATDTDGYPYGLSVGSNVTIHSNGYAVQVTFNGTHAYGVQIDLNGTINAPYGVTVNGTVQDTTGNVPVVNFNGTMTNGELFAAGYAKYNVNGNITETETAIEIRAGELNITGGNYSSSAAAYNCNPNGSGSTTEGAALAIAQHTTKKDIVVSISDGTFSGYYAISESNPQLNDPAPQVTMSITGGQFTGTNESKTAIIETDLSKCISGGTFSAEPAAELIKDGYEAVDNGNGTWTVQPKAAPVAQVVGGNSYETLQDAIDAAEAGDTVKLLKDINLTSADVPSGKDHFFEIKKGITIDGNSKTITATYPDAYNSSVWYVFEFVDGAKNVLNWNLKDLTIKSTGLQAAVMVNSDSASTLTASGLTITTDGECLYDNGPAKTVMTNCQLNHSGYYRPDRTTGNNRTYFSAVLVGYSGQVELHNCTVTTTDNGIATFPTGSTISLYDTTVTVDNSTVAKHVDETSALWAVTDTTAHELAVSSVIRVYSGSKILGTVRATNTDAKKSAKVIAYEGSIFSYDIGAYDNTERCGVFAADGCKVIANTDEVTKIAYPYTVGVNTEPVAGFNSTQYTTLAAAIADANVYGGTVTLLRNCAVSETIAINGNKAITLNLDGKKIGSTISTEAVMFTIAEGSNVTITGNGTITNECGSKISRGLIDNNGSLTVENVTLNDYGQGCGYALKNSGNMTIKSGTAITGFGTASGNAAIYNVIGELNIKDGVTIVNKATDGKVDNAHGYGVYAIRIDGGTTIIGTQTAETPTTVDGNRGAFAVNGGTLEINSGVFTGHIYRAMWITNDYAGTFVTINGGTFLPGKSGSVGASVDDGKQDKSDVAVTVNDGYFAGSFYHDSKKDSKNTWTFAIKGGYYKDKPSANLIADGYKAAAINESQGGITYKWQVGKVEATASTTGNPNTSNAVTYTVGTVIKDGNEEIPNSATTNQQVTIKGTTDDFNGDNPYDTISVDDPTSKTAVGAAVLPSLKSNKVAEIVAAAVESVGTQATDVTAINVVLVSDKGTEVVNNTITYEVHPEAIVYKNDNAIGSYVIQNDDLNENAGFMFTLDISGLNLGEYDQLVVTHIHGNSEEIIDQNNIAVSNDRKSVTIIGISSFSNFQLQKVASTDEQNDAFKYLGASLRRRVQISNRTNVVNTSTDVRFGYVIKDFDPYSEYYFRWQKGDGDWSDPVLIDKFAADENNTSNKVASLVITNVPSNAFNTTISTKIYKGSSEAELSGTGFSVNDVIAGLLEFDYEVDANKQWVDYAKYLKGNMGVYNYILDKDSNLGYYCN